MVQLKWPINVRKVSIFDAVGAIEVERLMEPRSLGLISAKKSLADRDRDRATHSAVRNLRP